MSRRGTWAAGAALCVGLLGLLDVLAAPACGGARGPGDGPVGVGSLAPDFELPDLAGGTVRLSSLRGKVVFVNFWATWCPPCRDEMPSMEALGRDLAGQPFEMLAVSVDEGGEPAVRRFLAGKLHSYRVLLDAASGSERLNTLTGQAYGITGVPETFIIDRRGYIVEKVVGPADWSDPRMLDYFRGLLAGSS
jgi:thiol-disulfide isomerase/thioredoxin